MFDCHVHSRFSFDSNAEPELICTESIRLGLSGIAFVDHLDYDFPVYGDEIFDFSEYFRTLESMINKYKSQLKILKGIEVGIQPHVIEKSLEVVRKYNFDYVLTSVHIINGMDPYKGDYYLDKSKQEAYSLYLEHTLNMAKCVGNFDVVGHMDYVIRCANYDDRTLRYDEHSDLIDSLFKTIISKGKGFEINTGSYRENSKGIPVADYDIKILKRYKELGGEIICLGSDAHSTEYLGCKFEYFKELLSEAGFKYLTHFENRKPVFMPIDS